ncbi:hypothetical protein BC941DRAFT_518254 [Chlamydoabsidia padenii]|nr:hypothetical protein BC941DRAFT_518254 [Chlamydoabsidia padenii]
MSSFNVQSHLTGKRLNTDPPSILANSWKKQRVYDNSSSSDNLTSNTQQTPNNVIANNVNPLAMKNQANKLLMTFVQNQTTIHTTDGVPHAQLKLNLYSTQLVDYIMDSPAYDYNERQVWSLASLLLGQTTPPPQRRLKNWIRSTVIEELEKDGCCELDVADDDWHQAFHYLASGQVLQACDLAKQLGDDALMMMIVVHLQQDGDVSKAAEQQVLYWQEQGLFDRLPLYQRKMWCVMLGRLGYVDLIKTTVTQGLAWPQVLLLYALYGGQNDDIASGLAALDSLTTGDITGIHQLQAREATAVIPPYCLWYPFLQWWTGGSHKSKWALQLPLRCRWLLLLHVPECFDNEVGVLESWRHQWCDELYHSGLEYMAILAGLYIPKPGPKIKQLLSLRQWEKDHYIARQLQIPLEWITDGKALYALNRHLYDKEVEIYLEANNIDKARHAILNHMIPAIYLDESQVDTITYYIKKLAELYPNDINLQQTTNILNSIHVILHTYPGIITQTPPAQRMTLVNDLKLALQNTKALQELNIFEGSSFCTKVNRELNYINNQVLNLNSSN